MVLCFAMILGLMVVGAGAAFNDQDSIDSKHTEAVDMCVALNIINGIPETDGSFKFDPTGNVTREQMAKMICVLDNGGKEPQGAPGTTFSDVAPDRWSNKFVEACAARGVVAGIGGGKFDPEGNVTGSQAAKMLLVELGYNQDLAKYTGAGWDTNVNIDATKKGYYDDLEDIDVSAPLSREHAAQMIWNALQAKEVEYSYTLVTNEDGSISSVVTVGDMTFGPGSDSLLTDKYETLRDEDSIGIVTGISYNTTKEKWTYTLDKIDARGVATPVNSFTTDKDYTDLLGHNVHFVAKATDDVYGAYAQDSKVAVEGLVGDITWNNDGSIEVDDNDYDFDSNASFYVFIPGFNKADALNGDTLDNPKDALVEIGGPGGPALQQLEMKAVRVADLPFFDKYCEFVAIDNDGNDDINMFIVYPIGFGQVTYVASDYVKAANVAFDGSTGPATSFDTKKDNQYATYDGIAKDDYVTVTADRTLKTYGAFANLEKQTGTVESITKDTITIDQTYDVPFSGNVTTDYLTKEFGYCVINGYVTMLKGTTNTDMSDFVLVVGQPVMTSSGKVQVDVMYIDGTVETMTVKSVTNSNSQNTDVIPQMLYSYEEDNGKYELTQITRDDLADFDDYGTRGQLFAGLSNRTYTEMIASDKGEANGKVAIADSYNYYSQTMRNPTEYKYDPNGSFFVYDDGEWSVKTGADLAKITDVTSARARLVCAEENDNGFTYVTYGVIFADGIVSSDWSYGIVTSDVSLSGSASSGSASFTMWNGTEEVPMTTAKRNTADGVIKEDVIAFTTNDDGDIDKLVIFTDGQSISDTGADANGVTAKIAAVVALDDEGNVRLANYSPSGTYETSIDDADTTVLFYDFDKNKGETGTVSKSAEADTSDYGVTYDGTKYFCDVLYVANSTDTDPLVLVVVDTAGDLFSHADWAD